MGLQWTESRDSIQERRKKMDLFRGSIVVDAKSFLGVLNMGLNRIIKLKVYAEDYGDMYQDIKQFIVSQ